MESNFKSGFVALIGRTNVGKSTLLNAILKQKLAIATNKPQTTRNTIRGIYNSQEEQIVFLDTPGIHKPKTRLGEYMIKSATDTLNDVDLILFLIDDVKKIGKGDEFIIDMLSKTTTPVFLVINKIDTMKPEQVKNTVEQYEKFDFVKGVFPISAIENVNVDELVNAIKKEIPHGPQYFPSDMITDSAEKFFVSEIIREKLLMYLEDEVPHGVAVVIESFKERKSKPIVDINAVIVCEREAHKAIIIGKSGRKLKGIGQSSRIDIESFLDIKVNLQLWVKVKSGWRDNSKLMQNYGYGNE